MPPNADYGTDAQVWAEAFCRKFHGLTVEDGLVDIGLMIGWFANAIEAGRTAGYNAGVLIYARGDD